MLIKPLFQKFIACIMNNHYAKFGCHISSNSRDKQGAEAAPQALSVSNNPGQIGLIQDLSTFKENTNRTTGFLQVINKFYENFQL